MKKVYLVYKRFSDGVDCVAKVFLNKENAENYVAEGNKFFFEEGEIYWYVEIYAEDYSETSQNDGKF